MSQDIQDFLTPSCDLLGLGEPAHKDSAFRHVRNELFAEQLVGLGFRSIALETDRVVGLAVNDFVQDGIGSLDKALSDGFSHGAGDLDGNRQLVAWMHEYNQNVPSEDRLAFHGFDAPTENMSAPSPRPGLEHARAYLGLDIDLPTGDDDQWSRTEAVLDATKSIGATPEADHLRAIADDMLSTLHARVPELIPATSRAEWYRAKTHLTAAIGLLRYHKQCAQRVDETTRISHLLGTRDVVMAQNLLDIRDVEAGRGPTLVFAHNVHLQRNRSHMAMNGMDLTWWSAGALVGSLVDERYRFIAGSLGRSDSINLAEPKPDTYEGILQKRLTTWGLTTAGAVPPASTRTDPTPEQGYFPLDEPTLDGANAVLHINATPA